MENIVIAKFRPGETSARVTGLWQWDYGQKLEIHGLDLPKNVSVEYSINKSEPTKDRIGITENNITLVDIPNEIMELHGDLKVYIRITRPDYGSTEYVISGRIKERERPSECPEPEPEMESLFGKTIEAVNEAAERAEDAEKSAEGWAHGHEDYPERDEDNAKYYAEQAMKASRQITEDTKKQIDEYLQEKKGELKGERGDDGLTPCIGDNGNWWVGEEDTGVTAQGEDGYTPQKGVDYFDGQNGEPGANGKSAYEYAQEGGYTGTEEDFAQKLAMEYPTDAHINDLIDAKLGVIENGTY